MPQYFRGEKGKKRSKDPPSFCSHIADRFKKFLPLFAPKAYTGFCEFVIHYFFECFSDGKSLYSR
ncbi:MAG: hypothetical protein A3E80_03705 [Chlamydiae bacterium RIFCSPHIGHO2_12_FULL_49_9]|nr:MAG: hypothetical protein A3E80_03705 [Chlamydiae bacterium RIFCSPHIGHO2_12_FULL_49_9]